MFFPNTNKLTSTPADAELVLKSDGKLWPIDADVLLNPVSEFDTVGVVMLAVLDQGSSSSTYPGSVLRGVSVGGAEVSATRLTGTYVPRGFVNRSSSDPLERTTVFQKIAE